MHCCAGTTSRQRIHVRARQVHCSAPSYAAHGCCCFVQPLHCCGCCSSRRWRPLLLLDAAPRHSASMLDALELTVQKDAAQWLSGGGLLRV
jgi:hypothetical protein